MQNPNVYFTNGLNASANCFVNSSQLFKTGPGIVLEVNNRDAKKTSWSAHLMFFFVPFPFINVEFEDVGVGGSFTL